MGMDTKSTITIYDVAREAGVSMATVSRVVNGNPNVKPSTRKKVSDVIERLNYRPNAVARGLASKKTTTVGVITPSITNLFFSSLARGIDDIATMYKYNIILANSDDTKEKEITVFHNLLAKQVDGIIFMGYDVNDQLRQEIENASTPVVFAGTSTGDYDFYSVNIDDHLAVEDAISRLLKAKTRPALVTGPAEFLSNQATIKGYKDALTKEGQEIDDSLIISISRTYKEADMIVDELLASQATSVLVTHDDVAAAILNALVNRGVKVPEDFMVVASHNSIITELVRPQLTSIEIPLYDIGAVAMRLLTKVMNKEEVDEKKLLLAHKIKERESTQFK